MTDRTWLNAGASNWLWLALVVLALDQYTKWLIIENLGLYDSITLLPYLDFMRLHNEGVAFSFFSSGSGWQRWVFSVLGLAVASAVVVWLRRIPSRGHHLLAAGLACIVGGALGNVTDRIFRGHVIDFIRVHYESAYFPAFNVADSSITIGAALLILDTLRAASKTEQGDSRS